MRRNLATLITWNREEGWRITGARVVGCARNFSAIIDAAAEGQIKRRTRSDECVQVNYHAVFPKEGAAVEIHIARNSNYLAFAVDVAGLTINIPRKSSEVCYYTVLPEEGGVVVSPDKSEIPTT